MIHVANILRQFKQQQNESTQINNSIKAHTFFPTQTGSPMMIAGTAIPAMSVMPTGAPISVPSCQSIFFLRLHGFLPQNVQPDGLTSTQNYRYKIGNIIQKKKILQNLTCFTWCISLPQHRHNMHA